MREYLQPLASCCPDGQPAPTRPPPHRSKDPEQKSYPKAPLRESSRSRLLMAQIWYIAIFMLTGQCTSVPATGCYNVSVNTGNSNNTALNSNTATISLSDLQSQGPVAYIFPVSQNSGSSSMVMLYDQYGNRLWGGNLNEGDHNFKTVILKDPLKLFVANTVNQHTYFHTVTVSSNVYSVQTSNNQVDLSTGGAKANLAVSDYGTNYIYVSQWDAAILSKIDASSNSLAATSSTEADINLKFAFFMDMENSANYIFLGGPNNLSLYNKADFSKIAAFTPAHLGINAYLVDNLNTTVVWSLNTGSYFHNWNLPSSTEVGSQSSVSAGSNANNILNFGPYQYVVTMPAGSASISLGFYNKLNVTSAASLSLSNSAASSTYLSFQGFISNTSTSLSNMYFAIIDTSSGTANFQSYYLTVDRCLTSSSNVCTACVTGQNYYLVTLTNGNTTCWLLSEFIAGYGVSGSYTGAACTISHCTNCLSSNNVCTACDTANLWYLKSSPNECESTGGTPTFAVSFGPDTTLGTVVGCSVSNCVACSAVYTTCTACATGYTVQSGSCVAASIPCSAGIATGGLTCTVAQCHDCCSDNTVCTACNANWYLDSNACYSPTTAPLIVDFKGADTSSGAVVTCAVSNCKLCKSDYHTCTGCDVSNNWYLNGNTCQSSVATDSTAIPNTFGANLTNGTVVACNDVNCLICQANYLTCTACKTTSGWYLNVNQCQSNSSSNSPTIPVSYGPNTTAGSVVHCNDSHCLTCLIDYLTCTHCDQASSWYLNASPNQCQSASTSPTFSPGFGPNSTSGNVEACAVTNCLTCKTSTSTCTACNTSAGWYLNNQTFKCNSATQAPTMPPGYGPNLTVGILAPCAVTNCLTCMSDYQICTVCQSSGGYLLVNSTCACDTSQDYFQNPTTLKCVKAVTLTNTGTGGNLASGQVANCTDPHCTDCHENYAVCTKCNMTAQYYWSNNSCVFVSNIPQGSGANNLTGNVTNCSMTGCLNCQPNFATCQQCDVANGYLFSNDSCSIQLPSAVLTMAHFNSRDSTAQVKFSLTLSSKSTVQQPFSIRFVDTLQNQAYTCADINCTLVSIDSSGFTFSFNSPISIVKGDLYFDATNSMLLMFNDSSVWTTYPIKVPDISFISKGGATAAAGSTMSTMNSARMPISIALAFGAPAAASMIDILMNTLFILQMLEGQAVSYPDAILNSLPNTYIMPINTGNPFETTVNNHGYNCTPSDQLANQNINCNLLVNEGVNFVQLAGVCAFSTIVAYLSHYVLRALVKRILRNDKEKFNLEELENEDCPTKNSTLKNENSIKDQKNLIISQADIKRAAKKSKAAKLVQTLGSVLGMQFFLIKLEGNQIEMIFMAMVGLKYSSHFAIDLLSAFLSVVFIIYYTVIAACCFWQSVWIWEEVERLQTKNRGRKIYHGELGKHVNLKKAPFPILNYSFEEMSVPDEYWKLLLPVIVYLKTMAICLVVVCIIGKPWQQVTMTILVETLMLIYEIISDIRYNKSEHWAEISMKCFTLMYLWLKLVTTSEKISDTTRQNKYGVAMAAALVLLMLTGALFAFYTMGKMLVLGIKALIAKIKSIRKLKELLNDKDKSAIQKESETPANDSNAQTLMPKKNENTRKLLGSKTGPRSKPQKGTTSQMESAMNQDKRKISANESSLLQTDNQAWFVSKKVKDSKTIKQNPLSYVNKPAKPLEAPRLTQGDDIGNANSLGHSGTTSNRAFKSNKKAVAAFKGRFNAHIFRDYQKPMIQHEDAPALDNCNVEKPDVKSKKLRSKASSKPGKKLKLGTNLDR